MEIKKTVVTTVQIDDNRRLSEGDLCKFTDGKRVFFGTFTGISSKGALVFSESFGKKAISYCVMPSSIEDIEVIEHEVK